MKAKDMVTLAAILATVYGTTEKQEAAQIEAAFIVAQKDMKA